MLDRTYYRALTTAELAERGLHNGGELEAAMAERLDDLLGVESQFVVLQTQLEDALRERNLAILDLDDTMCERDVAIAELNELKNKTHNH